MDRLVDIGGKRLLTLGAGLNFAVAILHLGIIALGAPAYLYFGAADFARLADAGSPLPALITLMLTAFFVGFALYALSGAGVIRRLPGLALGLVFISGLYILRGLIVFLDLIRLARGADYPLRQMVFSAVALAIGLVYLVGTIRQWGYLNGKRTVSTDTQSRYRN